MTIDEIKKVIRQVLRQYQRENAPEIGDNESLLDTKRINAGFVKAVMKDVEAKFPFIKREHFSQDTFATVNTIAKFVSEKSQKYDKIKKDVRRFVGIRLDSKKIEDNKNLFEIDAAELKFSLFLVTYFEEVHRIEITEKDINTHDLNSINGITLYIYTRKYGQAVKR